ncbi:MAG: hypothetical protein ACQESF_03895 [Nanobdellota archaeon]
MRIKIIKKHIAFISLLLIIVAFTLIFHLIGASGFVEFIGVKNSYLLVFLVGAFGGVSFFTAYSFILTVIMVSLGGANPFLIAVFGGLGITIGDTLFYLLGLKGRETLSGPLKRLTDHFSRWMEKQPSWLIPIVVLVYATIAPLPNDILTVSLGLCKCNAKQILPPLLVGNMLFTLLISAISISTIA